MADDMASMTAAVDYLKEMVKDIGHDTDTLLAEEKDAAIHEMYVAQSQDYRNAYNAEKLAVDRAHKKDAKTESVAD